MVLGDVELAFYISSITISVLFIFVFYNLIKRPSIKRIRKICYAIVFLTLMILNVILISIFDLVTKWDEVIMFNVIWIPFFLLMFQELAENPLILKIPFGQLIITAGLIISLVICASIVLMDYISFGAMGNWAISLPIFISCLLLIPFFLILIARVFGKAEKQWTEGVIESGKLFILYTLGAGYGLIMIVIGIYPIIFGADSWIPLNIGIPPLIIGLILFIYSIRNYLKERRKRIETGFGWG